MKLVKIENNNKQYYIIFNNKGFRTFKNKTINECLLNIEFGDTLDNEFDGEIIFEIEFKDKNDLINLIPEEFL